MAISAREGKSMAESTIARLKGEDLCCSSFKAFLGFPLLPQCMTGVFGKANREVKTPVEHLTSK